MCWALKAVASSPTQPASISRQYAAPAASICFALIEYCHHASKNGHHSHLGLRARQVLLRVLLKLPVFGELVKKIALARFTRNFAALLGAGVLLFLIAPLIQRLMHGVK